MASAVLGYSIEPTVLVKYVPELESFNHWNGRVSSRLDLDIHLLSELPTKCCFIFGL